MRHERRLLDQALDSSQALGEREELATFQDFARVVDIPAQYGGDDAAVTAVPLLLRKCMLRMARKAGVIHPFDLRMAREVLRNSECTRAVTLHPQGQGLDAAQRQKGIEGARNATQRGLPESQPC